MPREFLVFSSWHIAFSQLRNAYHGCYQIPLYTIKALSLAAARNFFIWFPLQNFPTPVLAGIPTTAAPLGCRRWDSTTNGSPGDILEELKQL